MIETALVRDVFRTLGWRRRFAILIALAFSFGAVAFANGLPDLYEARAVVSFLPRSDVSFDNAGAIDVVLPKYAAAVSAPETMQRVARAVDHETDDLEESTDVEIEPESSNLTIVVRLGSSLRAARAANALARHAVTTSEDDPVFRGEIVARAIPPGSAAAPRRIPMGGAALVVGLMLGTVLAYVVERAAPRIRTPHEVQRISGRPVLARIPLLRAVRTDPRGVFAHPDLGAAFRTLRANVERAAEGDMPKKISVTAPTEGAGATTVAALFAEAVARSGRRVLLVDADLRRPSIARRFRLDPERSLSAALRGTVPLKDAVKRGWVENLSVLTTKPDREGADLVVTRLPRLLTQAAAGYDLVVLDTPPLVGRAEGAEVAARSDAVLMVVRTGSLLDEIGEAVLSLDSLRTRVFGVIANGLPVAPDEDVYWTPPPQSSA